jgi:BirA family biotin operon repressor/biotin-[acetyl-CoA-carboxylase] ligase
MRPLDSSPDATGGSVPAEVAAPAEPRASRRLALVRLLADGRFHSGEALAGELGVSRAAVWKHVRDLGADLGLDISAVRGRGYRLQRPIELLDRERIAARLAPGTAAALAQLLVLDTVDSTSSALAGRRPPRSGLGVACVAEQQTAGRGRRGRTWVSPFGANVYLSLLWQLELPATALAGLSLAVGVAIAEGLHSLGATGVALKWPNDVICGGRKLGGILVELSGEAEGPTRAVVGVGVNHRMPAADGVRIDQDWTDLASAIPNTLPSRCALVAVLLDRLVGALQRFGSAGLSPFLAAWDALDGLRGREVVVRVGDQPIAGIALGVAPSGALRLRTAEGERQFLAGEVSVRTGTLDAAP